MRFVAAAFAVSSCHGSPMAQELRTQPGSSGTPARLFRAIFGAGELRARHLLAIAGAFSVAVVALHALCLTFYPKADLDPWQLSDFYPLSVFKWRRPHVEQVGLAVVTFGVFAWLWRRLSERAPPLVVALAAAFGLALLSNLLFGFRFGIDYPTATTGSGIEYYDDAVLIKGPLWFLARYNRIQFELLEHARTHPPGPVLLYYALHRLMREPALISLAICALSLGLALPYLRRLVRFVFGEEPPGALLLYAILPGILSYGLAVVDAVIASLFLAALVEFVTEESRSSAARSAAFVALSLFFTFGALFLLPVLVGFELWRRRRVTRSVLVIGGAALLLGALLPLTGFDWLGAFHQASAIENEKGFLLLANPRGYLWYRLGAVAEIMIFFTPFLGWLLVRGMGRLRAVSADGFALACLGPATLALMLLAGAMKIGEAARICLFILPYLLLPALAAFRTLGAGARTRTAYAVLAWGLMQQLVGFYQW